MSDKRKFRRIHLVYYLLVFDDLANALVGHVVDISREGMKLMTRTPLVTGARSRYKMLLPDDSDGGSRELFFEAECVWSQQNLYSDFYGAGIHFESMCQEDVMVIKSLIEKFGYRQ